MHNHESLIIGGEKTSKYPLMSLKEAGSEQVEHPHVRSLHRPLGALSRSVHPLSLNAGDPRFVTHGDGSAT